jgi:hypothetical protein
MLAQVSTAMNKKNTSSGILLRVALVTPDVSEERIAYIMRVRIIGEPGTTHYFTFCIGF